MLKYEERFISLIGEDWWKDDIILYIGEPINPQMAMPELMDIIA